MVSFSCGHLTDFQFALSCYWKLLFHVWVKINCIYFLFTKKPLRVFFLLLQSFVMAYRIVKVLNSDLNLNQKLHVYSQNTQSHQNHIFLWVIPKIRKKYPDVSIFFLYFRQVVSPTVVCYDFRNFGRHRTKFLGLFWNCTYLI